MAGDRTTSAVSLHPDPRSDAIERERRHAHHRHHHHHHHHRSNDSSPQTRHASHHHHHHHASTTTSVAGSQYRYHQERERDSSPPSMPPPPVPHVQHPPPGSTLAPPPNTGGVSRSRRSSMVSVTGVTPSISQAASRDHSNVNTARSNFTSTSSIAPSSARPAASASASSSSTLRTKVQIPPLPLPLPSSNKSSARSTKSIRDVAKATTYAAGSPLDTDSVSPPAPISSSSAVVGDSEMIISLVDMPNDADQRQMLADGLNAFLSTGPASVSSTSAAVNKSSKPSRSSSATSLRGHVRSSSTASNRSTASGR